MGVGNIKNTSMIIYEIEKPGTWLNPGNKEDNCNLQIILMHLIDSFYETNLSLNLFLEERIRNKLSHDLERESWEKDNELRQKVKNEVEADYSVDDYYAKYDEINFQTEIKFKKEQWSSGKIPSTFSNSLIFIHARTFLYALDNFERLLGVLINENGAPTELKNTHKCLLAKFPDLRGVRNSAHHKEDRVRGLNFNKKIDLKPISNGLIHAPSGNVLITNSLNGNKYGSTLGNGNFGEVEVSEYSLIILGEILQEVLNLFSWSGSKEHLPR